MKAEKNSGTQYTPIALGLQVYGIVQGVGFRPFVYQLAEKWGINGTVANTTTGVCIHVEGRRQPIDSFCAELSTNCPPLARITDIKINPEKVRRLRSFTIIQSNTRSDTATFVSPDVSVCDDCLREMNTPSDRRYRYPFINCTNCGPRYTIIEDIPYDRPKTAMKRFNMCERCRAEYENPTNRRFHAQPNACPVCGPRVSLYDNKQHAITTATPVETAIRLLKKGHILAVKGLGGFHLAVNAKNDAAVTLLRNRKNRPDKPFALMSLSVEHVREYARISPEEATLLSGMPRPIVLLEKRPSCPLSRQIAPGNRYVGVMLPYTPLHYLLLNSALSVLVMTSGNRSGEPLCINNQEAFDRLSDIADYFLVHDRPVYQRNDDTLMRAGVGNKVEFIRRARGYVPAPIALSRPLPPTLACGGELKNTICLARDHHAIVSQHIGDMSDPGAFDFFKETIAHLKKISKITPRIVAHDLHPDYLSTQYALGLSDVHHVAVQHHHAHVVGCMAEHALDDPVIGLALDGTGYGTDGAIWGGEVLIATPESFTRAAHLAYVPMPGGAAAIHAPWRMAVSYLHHAFGKNMPLDLPFLKEIDQHTYQGVMTLLTKKIHAPATSSTGRLFDGIAAMAGLGHTISFEGQAAMALEAAAGPFNSDTHIPYEWGIINKNGIRHIDIAPLIRRVVRDLLAGVPVGEISGRFHHSLVCLFGGLCVTLRRETGLNRVVMSGGVFQNKRLSTELSIFLGKERFKVYSHGKVPANDGGLSLGQAVAAARIAEG